MKQANSQPITEETAYILGTEQEELQRLGFQHRVWAKATFALWERAGFSRSQRLLDVGCGPGFATIDLASIVGSEGAVLGVDKSERYIEYLCRQAKLGSFQNIEAYLTSFDNLNLPDGSLDGAYCRWVLCWVENPEDLIKRVTAALRPGAPFVVLDYFNWGMVSLVPDNRAFNPVKGASLEIWRNAGSDINIGSRLPKMFQKHGLQVESIEPLAHIARPGSMMWEWMSSFFQIWVPKLVKEGLLSLEEQQEFESSWEHHRADSVAFCVAPTMVEIIGRKL